MSEEEADLESELPDLAPDAGADDAPQLEEDGELVFSALDDEAEAPTEMGVEPLPEMPMGEDFAEPEPLPDLAPEPEMASAAPPGQSGDGLDAVLQIPITVEIVLGTASMTVSELAALAKGSKIPLDRKVGEPVDVVVNGRVIAHGSVVMLEDGTDRFGISLETLASQNGQGAARSA